MTNFNTPNQPGSTTPRSPGDVGTGQAYSGGAGTPGISGSGPATGTDVAGTPAHDQNREGQANMNWSDVGKAPYADAATGRGEQGSRSWTGSAKQAAGKAREYARDAGRRASHLARHPRETVDEFPFTTLAVSFGAGVLIGYLLKASMESDTVEIAFEPEGGVATSAGYSSAAEAEDCGCPTTGM